jgi:hypothetical protein
VRISAGAATGLHTARHAAGNTQGAGAVGVGWVQAQLGWFHSCKQPRCWFDEGVDMMP